MPVLKSSKRAFVTVGFNHADYICDGTADEEQINAAIDAAYAVGGGTVFIKEGTYSINSPIINKNYVHVRGAGMYTTRLAATVNLRAAIFDNRSLHDIDNPTIEQAYSDLELDGSNMVVNPSLRYKGINGEVWYNCKVYNIYCHDTTATGIGPDNLYKSTIDRCIVENCGTAGIFASVNLVSDNTNPTAADTVRIGSTYASGILTSDGTVPTDGDTVTIDAIVYTFKNTLSSAYHVHIEGTALATLDNLRAAVNKASGEGTKYGTGTVRHTTVTARNTTSLAQGFVARQNGTPSNSIVTTETSTHLSWGAATLTNGTDIVYIFVSSLVNPYDVLIGANADATLANLKAAINQDAGSGITYGSGTEFNELVQGGTIASHTLPITARSMGSSPNTITVGEASTHLSFSDTTLTGGTGVPIGNNGIGIATGQPDESFVVSNCVVVGSANNDYLIEADVDNESPNNMYVFANNISINAGQAAFRNSGARNVTITGNKIYNPTTNGIRNTDATAAHEATNLIMTDNTIIGAGSYGIYQAPLQTDFLIAGNVIRDGDVEGIIVGASNGTIVNNDIHDNGKYGVSIGAFSGTTDAVSNILVTNNRVYNNGKLVANCDGIRLHCDDQNLSDITVTGNRCYDNQTTKTQRYGIVAFSDPTNTMSNILIANNNVSGNLTAGILKSNTSPGISIKNNPGFNPEWIYALGSVTGSPTFNRLNGSVQTATLGGNITPAFTDGIAYGDMLTLQLTQDGTGGRTMTLPANTYAAAGGLTLSTTAGAIDTVSFYWDTVKWRELSRSIKDVQVTAINVVTTSVNYPMTSSNDVVLVSVSTKIVTLHDATTAKVKAYRIKNTSNGNISFATTSSQTVDGSTTGTIIPNQSLTVIPDGTNWVIV